jgi:hypothetical protein
MYNECEGVEFEKKLGIVKDLKTIIVVGICSVS